MQIPMACSRNLTVAMHGRTGCGAGVMAKLASVVLLMATLPSPGVLAQSASISRPFENDAGTAQSATDDPSLDAAIRSSLRPGHERPGVCHLPRAGPGLLAPSALHPGDVRSLKRSRPALPGERYHRSPGRGTVNARGAAGAFKLFLDLGVARIGRPVPAGADFTVAAQTTDRFGPLPNPNDPQIPGALTLSLFRRPLATTNVHFDSSVLWDGRAAITNMRAQVQGATRTLLLGNASNADADAVAALMLGVFPPKSPMLLPATSPPRAPRAALRI